MKYKVTTRGWIVFSIIGILLIFSLFSIIGQLFDKDGDINLSSDDNNSSINQEILDNQEINDGQSSVNEDDEPSEVDNKQTNDEEVDSDASSDASSDDNKKDDVETEVVISEIDLNKRDVILFDKNNFDLDPAFHGLLDEWYNFLSENKSVSVIIEGHINGYPYYDDGPYGLNISEKRADVVRAYLVDKGIDATRITLLNKGSTAQATISDDPDQHYLNRRAIIYISKD